MLTKKQKLNRIMDVKFVAEEFITDKGWFIIEDLYWFFYKIARYFEYTLNELERIIAFLVRGNDLWIKKEGIKYVPK